MKRNILLLLTTLVAIFSFAKAEATSVSVKAQEEPVIIIGAGIAGLSAAHFLKDHHIPVLVLEARNRIGGRINTVYPWGIGLDLGASWIHGINHNPINELAKKAHLATPLTVYDDNELLKKFNSFVLYDAAGKKISAAEIKQIATIAKKFDDEVNAHLQPSTHQSIQEALLRFLKENTISPQFIYPVTYAVTNVYLYEFAADLSDLSASANLPYEHSLVSGENALIPQGYQQILPTLTKQIPIELNQTVKKIAYNNQGVDVYTKNAHYHSRYVILTVPLGVLKAHAIDFVPALPKAKENAIQQLHMSVYDKIYLLFDHCFWDKQSEWLGYVPTSSAADFPPDIMNFYKFTHVPILIAFTAGSSAKKIETWSDKKTVDYIMHTLKAMYGDHIEAPTAYVITRWSQDAFTHGSYSYLPPGANTDDFKILSTPINNRLFFAGEATSLDDPATAHGAYTSGVRAAKEVMRAQQQSSI